MTISLSNDAICTEIYARAALRAILGSQRPLSLTPAQRPALTLLISAAFTSICLRTGLKPHSAPDSDILSAEAQATPDAQPEAIRKLLESHLAATVMAQAYSGSDDTFAASLASMAERSAASLTELIAPCCRSTPLPRKHLRWI